MSIIHGTNGHDDLIGGDQADTIYGYDGNDHIEGRGGNDALHGGEGYNTILAGAGVDYVTSYAVRGSYDGGSGTDTIDFGVAGSGGRFDLEAGWGNTTGQLVTQFTLKNFENIWTSFGNDTVWGTGAANEIRTGGGTDFVYGRGGDDTLRAGSGDDAVDGGEGGDWIEGGAGNDNLLGGAGDDRVFGEDGADLVWGGLGDDALYGGRGNDMIDGEGGFDTLIYGGHPAGVVVDMLANKATSMVGNTLETDTIHGIEKVIGSYSHDILVAGATTELDGNTGIDVLVSGSGANRMTGGAGEDYVSYQASTAGVSVNLATEAASGGWANGDVLASFEHAIGSDHADTLRGSGGANSLRGGRGNDALYGEGGADVLQGERGADQLWGGAGADKFLYAATADSGLDPATLDTIRDFAAGDRIDLHLLDADGVLAGNQAFANITYFVNPYAAPNFDRGTINVRHIQGNTYVDINTSDQVNASGHDYAEMQIKLAGIHALDLGDFVL
jgi:Ca2+-binding RTX toxin-like protein